MFLFFFFFWHAAMCYCQGKKMSQGLKQSMYYEYGIYSNWAWVSCAECLNSKGWWVLRWYTEIGANEGKRWQQIQATDAAWSSLTRFEMTIIRSMICCKRNHFSGCEGDISRYHESLGKMRFLLNKIRGVSRHKVKILTLNVA